MGELEDQISNNIKKLENMIKSNEDKDEIEKQRKILDKLLEQYLSNFK